MIVPLLPYPHLSTSAKVLDPEDAYVQFVLAMDSYDALMRPIEVQDKIKFKSTLMWGGCTGALLFWVGELARHLPQDGREWARWVTAWGNAYRDGEMAIGRLPWWLGDHAFHYACQSQLIAARPTVYGGWFPHAPLDIMYRMPLAEEHTWQTL